MGKALTRELSYPVTGLVNSVAMSLFYVCSEKTECYLAEISMCILYTGTVCKLKVRGILNTCK